MCKTDNNIEYLIHEHYPDKSVEHKLTLDKYNNMANCIYWPHYSFRPSVIKTDIFKHLGSYDNKSSFFEREYANRYNKENYISCFFNKVTCRHIGKLTSDKGTNAYTLNNINQFNINNINKYKILCVNLKRRLDRKKYMLNLFNDNLIIDFEFYEAIDGSELQGTEDIFNLFKNNDFGYRKNVIGCALSHYEIWKNLIQSEYEYYIIFEDDIKVSNDFRKKLNIILNTITNSFDYHLILLGYSMFENIRDIHRDIYNNMETYDINILDLNKDLFIGGTFGYIINKVGAKYILDYIDKNNIKHGIDYLFKIIPDFKIYECKPNIVFSDINDTSDIQFNYDRFDFDKILKDKWTFYNTLDCGNNDISFLPNKSPIELIRIASENPECIAFNTLGFLKDNINLYSLHKSIYFSDNDGIYIRNDIIKKYDRNLYSDKIRVKMICNWTNSKNLCNEWNNMTQGNYTWNNIQLTWEDNNIDYYIIINKSIREEFYIPQKTIIFHMEPWCYDKNQNWGVKTWGEWANPDPNLYLQVRNHKNYHNNVFWQLKLTWKEFKNNKIIKDDNKNNIISTICSSKYFDPGHIKRIDFIKFIENKNDPDVVIHIYNYDNLHNFKNYKGPHPENNKDFGIIPYKYYFMSENNIEHNFITEKIWEPILSESLCFYWGCPNLSDYIDSRAYVELDLNDFEKSFNIIKNSIKNNLWEERLDIIKKEKNKILDYYGFCPTIERIINDDINITLNLYDIYLKQIINTNKINNICFIHSCTINNNINILKYIINYIIDNNLIDILDMIIIINIGTDINNIFNNDKIQIINYSNDILLFEIPTINLIYSFSHKFNNVNVLYLHTKGITYDILSQSIQDWIDLMLYFLVHEYNTCIELLKKHDIIGCNLLENPKLHYSGNFWWSNTNYIKTLYRIKSNIKHDAEWWICSNKMSFRYSIYDSYIDHYCEVYPSYKYNKLIKFRINNKDKELNLLDNDPLFYLFEHIKYSFIENTLWIIINSFYKDNSDYISKYNNNIYKFDINENNENIITNNKFFDINTDKQNNILLLKNFLYEQNKKISFLNIDTNYYKNTKQILNLIKPYLYEKCIILFNNIINFDNYEYKNNNLKALYDFIHENEIKYEWIYSNKNFTSLVISFV